MTNKHLFLALSRKGWGETSLGLEVAKQLRAAGDKVEFLAASGGLSALAGSGFPVSEISDSMGPFFHLFLEETLREDAFRSIVLCDFLTTNYTLQRFGLSAETVLDFGLPVLSIDTWDFARTGATMDVFGVDQWQIGTWMERIAARLLPVPIGGLETRGAYCGLPTPTALTDHARIATRAMLGLGEDERVVLFCTARWQHDMNDPAGQRIVEWLPQMLWLYLRQLGPRVRLIHVGPAPLGLQPPSGQYLWQAPSAPDEFHRLLGSTDLVLSANISATSLSRALVANIPILVVENSSRATTLEEAACSALAPLSREAAASLKRVLPLYPFSLWPLGGWKFLRPLLRDNAYSSAIEVVEILHESLFVDKCRRLLFETDARDKALARQADYCDKVRRLPTAAELVHRYLN